LLLLYLWRLPLLRGKASELGEATRTAEREHTRRQAAF
jgi:hypothetical protein